MVQGGCRFSKDIPPLHHRRTRPHLLRGHQHRGAATQRSTVHNAYRLIYQSGLNTTEALQKIETEMEQTKEIQYIVNFIKESARGIIPGK